MASTHTSPDHIRFLTEYTGRPVLDSVDEVIYKQIKAIDELKELANKHPYYK